ncbi:SDR family oxidoreductase [Streptomyces scopuliridis]|uniref:SDR family oxidoreductase n=1 Tax=Streptomyces scopuliridis TaxID=452529 RepID=UPI003687233B
MRGDTAAFLLCAVIDETLADASESAFGKLGLGVQQPGANGAFAPIGDMDSAVGDRVMKLSLYSVPSCLKHEVHALQENKGGPSGNTASGAGLIGITCNTQYTADKLGAGRHDPERRHGPRAQGHPGRRARPRLHGHPDDERLRAEPRRGVQEQHPDEHPDGSAGRAADQADAVMWLCSDQARMVTGATLPVDAATRRASRRPAPGPPERPRTNAAELLRGART